MVIDTDGINYPRAGETFVFLAGNVSKRRSTRATLHRNVPAVNSSPPSPPLQAVYEGRCKSFGEVEEMEKGGDAFADLLAVTLTHLTLSVVAAANGDALCCLSAVSGASRLSVCSLLLRAKLSPPVVHMHTRLFIRYLRSSASLSRV